MKKSKSQLNSLFISKNYFTLSVIQIFLLAFSGIGQNLPSVGDEYLETLWTTEQGLPQNSINAILQSHDGYIWIGTFGGLARFDGVRFTTYNSGNTSGIKSNRILSLFEDTEGTIWIGTQSGEVMTFKNGKGKTYTQIDGVPSGFIWAINQSVDGAIWVGGQNGAARFADGRFKSFTMSDGLPDSQVWAINKDENKQLVFTVGGNLAKFDGEKFNVIQNSSHLKVQSWTATSRRNAGGWWLGAGNQIAKVENDILQFIPINKTPKGDLRTLYETNDGAIWVSYTTPTEIYQLRENNLFPYSLKFKNDLRSMLEDSEGNLWVGTDGGGLLRLKKKKLKTLTIEDGLPSDNIRTIIEDENGGVWIATTEGLVYWKDEKITKYTTRDGLFSDYVTALCRDRNENTWIGSQIGLTKFKDGKFSKFTASDVFADNTISIIFEDSIGGLWVGTHKGLYLIQNETVKTFQESDGLVNNDVRTIKQTADGTLWFGTVGGLSSYKDGRFKNYKSSQGLSNDFVRDIFINEDGSLWLATYGGGLNLLKNEKFIPVKTKDGLFDDFVSRILLDKNNNFWLLGNRGISSISREELNNFTESKTDVLNPTSYGVADGMKSSEGNGTIQPAGWQTKDGRMWFPTIKGVVIIDPHETNKLSPPVTIEQVTIDRNVSELKDKITINYGQENIEIAYTGLSFSRPEQMKFKYRLDGLSDNWINTGTRRVAYFSYLPPGEYTFEVLANNDGAWSIKPATIKLVVLPPFWRTWWFLLFCILGIGLIVFATFRLRIHRLKQKNAAQEEFSRRLINAHEIERRRIAAELHDSIGQSLAMIKNSAIFGLQSVENVKLTKEQFEDITNESSLAISEVREIAFNLRPYLLERLGLTKAINAMINKIADNFPLKIVSHIDDIDELFEQEEELSIYRIIQESMNNVIKHSEATKVNIEIKNNERQIVIKISDNGKGFETNSINQVQSGFGLLGMSERVRMLGSTISIESFPDQGTTIVIKSEIKK